MGDDWKQRIGVGERQHHYGRHAGTDRVTTVVAEEGPLRGHPVGKQKEHWSGRVDAKAERFSVEHNVVVRKVES